MILHHPNNLHLATLVVVVILPMVAHLAVAIILHKGRVKLDRGVVLYLPKLNVRKNSGPEGGGQGVPGG